MSRIDTREARRVVTSDRHSEPTAPATAAGGSALAALGGVCVAGCALAGLAGAYPITLAAIATIVFGLVLAVQGGSLGTPVGSVFAEAGGPPPREGMAGMGGVVAGGMAGIVLGILALLDVVPVLLMAVSAIVFGVCLWLYSLASFRSRALAPATAPVSEEARLTTPEAVWIASGIPALVGLAVIVLGIIGVVESATTTALSAALSVTLVALLCLGCAALIRTAAVCGNYLTCWTRK